MGVGGRTEQSGGAGADNVIRFPREWFGGTEGLVPIGPAADRAEAAERERAEAAASAERAAEVARAEADELSVALTAQDFWGEGSEALQQPVRVEAGDELAAPVGGVAAEGVSAAPGEPAEALVRRLASFSSRLVGLASRLRRPSRPVWAFSGLSVRRVGAAGAVALMLVAAVALFVLGHPGSTPTVQHPEVATKTPLATGVVGAGLDTGRLATTLEQDVRHVMKLQAGKRHVRANHHVARVKRHVKRKHVVAHKAAVPVTHHATSLATPAPTSASAESESESATAESVSSETSAADSSVSDAGYDSSPSSSSPPQTEQSAAVSDDASSLPPAGPSTEGSAGPNCNPQCH